MIIFSLRKNPASKSTKSPRKSYYFKQINVFARRRRRSAPFLASKIDFYIDFMEISENSDENIRMTATWNFSKDDYFPK